MEMPAFRLTQHGKPIFVTFVTPEILNDENRIKPDIWDPSHQDGYQRDLETSRARSFAKYMENTNNVSPTALLLSSRKKLDFRPKEGNYGILTLPDNEPLYEVDGQHRVAGIRRLLQRVRNLDALFPAIIISPPLWGTDESSEARFAEAKQFVVINRTQKRVRVDLSERWLAKLTPQQRSELEVLGTPEELEELKLAVGVADGLRKKTGSVWQNQIKWPDGSPGIVSQKSFTDSLHPILSEEKFAKGMSLEELIDALDSYWSAWYELCPLSFDNPDIHVIQKTTGVHVLHMLFVEVAKWLWAKGQELSRDNFYALLSNMTQGITPDYWNSSKGEAGLAGTGRKGINHLAKNLKDSFVADNLRALQK